MRSKTVIYTSLILVAVVAVLAFVICLPSKESQDAKEKFESVLNDFDMADQERQKLLDHFDHFCGANQQELKIISDGMTQAISCVVAESTCEAIIFINRSSPFIDEIKTPSKRLTYGIGFHGIPFKEFNIAIEVLKDPDSGNFKRGTALDFESVQVFSERANTICRKFGVPADVANELSAYDLFEHMLNQAEKEF